MWRSVLQIAALGILTGCYFYRPVGTLELHPGARVCAELTDVGAHTLTRDVGPGITALRGGVVSAESADVVLAVSSVTDGYGREQSWRGERVRLPQLAVQRVQRRQFSLSRTLFFGAAFLGGSVAVWEAFRGGISGGSLPPGRGGSTPQ